MIYVCLQESLKRILTIFAKLNPGIRYVQGMNEVLAPLYYVFKNDPEENNAVSVFFSHDAICLKLLNVGSYVRSLALRLKYMW